LAFADESQSICKLKAKKSTEERQQKRMAAEENGSTNKPIEEGEIHAEVI
jgi:hypothetical protein